MKTHNRSMPLIVLAALLMTCLLGVTVYAHAALATEVEPGIVRFHYDDDSPMAKAFITVYDTQNNEIETSQTDKDGLFDYSGYENVGTISAGDPGGHHVDFVVAAGIPDAEDTPPADTNNSSNTSPSNTGGNTWIVIVVVVAIAVVAGAAYMINKNKTNKS